VTVIVSTDRGMWADSKCGGGNGGFPTEKIFRYRGELIGTAGNNNGIQRFMLWYRGSRKKPITAEDGEDWEIIVLNRRGIFTYANTSFCDRVLRPFHAVGCGRGEALAALLAGASPHRAVEIACEINDGCGPPVQAFTLAGKEQYKFAIPTHGRGIALTAA
jgi:hypothetical protein